jgi:hypothetical protein
MLGFSGKVESLTKRLYKKTHVGNYSTDTLPYTVSIDNDAAPIAADHRRYAVHDRAGDHPEPVTLDGKRGEHADAATVDAHTH